MKRLRLLSLLAMAVFACGTEAQNRIETVLSDNWKFSHDDNAGNAAIDFDDSKWEEVCVPHDWAIAGPFDNNVDRQTVAIEQNGETEATEKSGRTGSLPWVGTGWYRTHFQVGKDAEHVILSFDGAMAEPEVFVGGKKAGEWKFGYNAFMIDVSKLAKKGEDNILAVRLRNRPESSRWYPGAGIYRPVKVIETGAIHIGEWSVNCVTKAIGQNTADIDLSAEVMGESGRKLRILYDLTLAGEKSRTERSATQAYEDVTMTGKSFKSHQSMQVRMPKLWTPETPYLYDLSVMVYEKVGTEFVLVDKKIQKVGIRTVVINSEEGFALNGVKRKIKGVCLHHDLGMFGAAVNKDALARQILLLKSMGCDAIRTAHNMPSQMQMDLCDSLGMMVMAESFDMWQYPKCKNGYALFYKDWWRKDLTNLVLANRHHPSIVMWSIGNEIPEQGSKEGAEMCREMQNFVHGLDGSRLCTTGMDRWDACVTSGFAGVIDIVGLNYRTHRYDYAHENLPQGFVLGSETASTVSSRGAYKFPVKMENGKVYDDGQCNGYDVEACWWSNLPEEDWQLQDDNDWVIGEFVWTGFDYLGEPTPYDGNDKSRSSYFGIFDLAGLPKDRYWLYRSHWNKDEHTIHLLPHWTWPGREGEVTPVYCYTDYPTAELFVNGKSQGRVSKQPDLKGSRNNPAIDRYRIRWNEVKYEPGEIKVVVYDKDGNKAGEQTVRTTGEPHHVEVVPEYESLPEYAGLKGKEGNDIKFYVARIVDKDGNLCPTADNRLTITVKGEARFRGICNGDATSWEVFTQPTMKAFYGQLAFAVEGGTIKDIKVKMDKKNQR